jgi:preprotein translocase subunit YajC
MLLVVVVVFYFLFRRQRRALESEMHDEHGSALDAGEVDEADEVD